MKPRKTIPRRLSTLLLRSFIVCVLCLTAGCNQPKNIPDDKLVAIVGDLFLSNAYWETQNGYRTLQDSLDLYTPVFNRYGYEPKDFLFTIQNLSKRKSLKFSDVMQAALDTLQAAGRPYIDAVARMDSVSRIAGERYKQVVRFDSLPQQITALKHAGDKAPISINLQPGRYQIELVYELDTTDRNPYVQYMHHVTSSSDDKFSYLYRSYSKGKRNHETMSLEVSDSSWRTLEIYPAYSTLTQTYETHLTIDSLRITRFLPNEQALDSINKTILYHPQDSSIDRRHECDPQNIIPFRVDAARLSTHADSLVRPRRNAR